MTELTPDTVIARSPFPLTAPVDDELVMLDTGSSTYFGIDRIGRRIWALLEEPTSIRAICAELQPEFDVSEGQCLADVTAFLDQLKSAELVEVR